MTFLLGGTWGFSLVIGAASRLPFRSILSSSESLPMIPSSPTFDVREASKSF